MGFSPLNGEVILKEDSGLELGTNASFSPLNGEVILKAQGIFMKYLLTFQSPQWGSNSKAATKKAKSEKTGVSVPSMGK